MPGQDDVTISDYESLRPSNKNGSSQPDINLDYNSNSRIKFDLSNSQILRDSNDYQSDGLFNDLNNNIYATQKSNQNNIQDEEMKRVEQLIREYEARNPKKVLTPKKQKEKTFSMHKAEDLQTKIRYSEHQSPK